MELRLRPFNFFQTRLQARQGARPARPARLEFCAIVAEPVPVVQVAGEVTLAAEAGIGRSKVWAAAGS